MDVALKSARQKFAVEEIEADYENIFTAWRWAIEQLDMESQAFAVGCLIEYYEITYRQFEAEEVFSQAIQKIEASFVQHHRQPRPNGCWHTCWPDMYT